jgi:uncharacterized protein RhaS with RHS repeats
VGRNWKLGIDRRVTLDTPTFATAMRPDGRRLVFRLSGGAFVPDADIADRLVKLTDAGGVLTGWRYIPAATEETETYDAAGRLVSVANRAGLAWSLAYDPA